MPPGGGIRSAGSAGCGLFVGDRPPGWHHQLRPSIPLLSGVRGVVGAGATGGGGGLRPHSSGFISGGNGAGGNVEPSPYPRLEHGPPSR
jgi:hypothetical protein